MRFWIKFQVVFWFLFACMFLFSMRLFAAPSVAPNVGLVDVQVLPGPVRLGLYGYVGASTVVDAGELTLVPELLVEWSPEAERWGFVGVLTGDYLLSQDMGVDVILALAHDQSGTDWGEAVFSAGPGIGYSFFLGDWIVSPFAIFYKTLNGPGWSWTPGLNVGYAVGD